MKILLATDGSVHSNVAVEEVANGLFPPGSEVRIVSAFESTGLIVSVQAPMGGLAGAYDEADTLAQKLAEGVVKVATEIIKEKNPALSTSNRVINASAKQAILNEADEFGADIIVVGSHGQSALSRFLLGSVSHAVALHANCSVEIVRKRVLEDEIKKS